MTQVQRSWLLRSLRKKRRQIFIIFLIFIFSITLLIYLIQDKIENSYSYYNPRVGGFNYFLEAAEHSKMGFIVDTPKCQIPNVSAWDKDIVPILTAAAEISEHENVSCLPNRQWTFIEKGKIVINKTAIQESGYKFEDIFCCYKSINRIGQNPEKYDSQADAKISIDNECIQMEEKTEMRNEFIRVHCMVKYWPFFSDIVYRYFHAYPIPAKFDQIKIKNNKKNINIKKNNKNEEDENTPPPPQPPNVLILGIDSLSRLGFERNMIKTKSFLEEIGAIEMLGYTKVGENTFPNALGFLTGYKEREIEKICYFSKETKLDSCPFIWKNFQEANYATALVEDVPLLATFNYMKTGFVIQPTDFYLRPFMLAVHEFSPVPYYTIDCIGRQTVDETILNYLDQLLTISKDKKIPIFIHSWLTNLAHANLNGAKKSDDIYLKFLKNADLNNTILFFMSDHGYRYGTIRQTFAGWIEDKLPNMWVYLPKSFRKDNQNSNAKGHFDFENLKKNSNKLTSPFDLYKTLVDITEEAKKILKSNNKIKSVTTTTSTTTENINTKSDKDSSASAQKVKMKSRKIDLKEIKRQFGISFFEEIPLERACKEAGIMGDFCVCTVPKKLEVSDPHLKTSSLAVISHINDFLPEQCAKLSLKLIIAGAVMENVLEKMFTYIVSFITQPGDFLYESNVNFYPESNKYTVSNNTLRMNKITHSYVTCINDDFLERFCYCK